MLSCAPVLLLLLACACTPLSTRSDAPPPPTPPRWAIAIHGGAGASPDLPEAERRRVTESLAGAIAAGAQILEAGGTSLDAVTEVVRILEDDPRFNAGRGAVLTSEGRCELDASIMNGADKNCGAVASVTTVRNPVLVARAVLEKSRHVFLAGAGAERFAEEQGFAPIDNAWLRTERRIRALEERRAREAKESSAHRTDEPALDLSMIGTVGAVALDSHGHLAAATSTGGLTNKRYGRIGDSPVIGAGTYADDAACAVSCTGIGELYIRHAIAHSLAARVSLAGETLAEAAHHLIHEVLPDDSGGLIAIDRQGRVTLPYNTPGMFRATVRPGEAIQVWIGADPESGFEGTSERSRSDR